MPGSHNDFVPLSLRLPFDAVNGQMMPMLVLQFSERRQDATKIQFRGLDSFETPRSLIEISPEAEQPLMVSTVQYR